jgi:16S rRNA (guanine527-N7)-methyltransferase
MSEDWNGSPQSDPSDKGGERLQVEVNQGGGKPRPYISRIASASTPNVGAGLVPAPKIQIVRQSPAPTQVNPALKPFLEGLHQLGLELTEQQSGQFLRYREELLDWNTRINLTAITNPEEVMIKHFLDSLSLLMAFDAPEARLLDIGAGAGFPGLPLKIVHPQWQLLLLEATGKKVAFLQHLIETLSFTNIVAVHGRAEELAHKAEYRASFDVVTARAVASLPALLEYAAPFCRVGGQIIFPKKGELAGELAQGKSAARKVGAVLKDDIAVRLPGLDDGRRLLVWEQVSKCPAQFPRSGTVMAKKPLG